MTYSTRAELKKSISKTPSGSAAPVAPRRRISRSIFAALAVSAFAVATIAPAALALSESSNEISAQAATADLLNQYDNAQQFQVSAEAEEVSVERSSYEAYKAPEPVIVPAAAGASIPVMSPEGSQFSLREFQFRGVIYSGGNKFTFYSERVLRGGGLNIPGRHVNAGGYVADGDGYISLAAAPGIPHGTVYPTPFGYAGKVYDTCATCSPEWLDVYTR